jgi:hypothetical protein
MIDERWSRDGMDGTWMECRVGRMDKEKPKFIDTYAAYSVI